MKKYISLPVDSGGCGSYRIRQPFDMLKRFTDDDTHIIDQKKDDMGAITKAVLQADAIVSRPGSEKGAQMLLANKDFKDKKWILDIDDNVELIDPYSTHYKEYGIKEVKHDGEWLWKDGEGNFDLKANKMRMDNHIRGMQTASLITVTTEKLKEYALQYNKNVAVLPNAINFEMWWPLPLKKNKQLRVIWSGGVSHYRDWRSIKEPLNKLMKKYQFKLIMVGSAFPGIIDEENKHLLETHGWVPFVGHSYRMMCMAGDIAIIPLEDMEFNKFKSSIKWHEMSAMKVPSLVSNILPYSEDIEHGKTALGYRTPKEFTEGLTALLEGSIMRKKIGDNAYKWTKKHRNAKKIAKLYSKIYGNL